MAGGRGSRRSEHVEKQILAATAGMPASLPKIQDGTWARFAAFAAWDTRLTRQELRLLMALGLYASDTGLAWPSAKALATILGSHEKFVRRCLSRLADYGYLLIVRRKHPTRGGWTSSAYILTFPPPPDKPRVIPPEPLEPHAALPSGEGSKLTCGLPASNEPDGTPRCSIAPTSDASASSKSDRAMEHFAGAMEHFRPSDGTQEVPTTKNNSPLRTTHNKTPQATTTVFAGVVDAEQEGAHQDQSLNHRPSPKPDRHGGLKGADLFWSRKMEAAQGDPAATRETNDLYLCWCATPRDPRWQKLGVPPSEPT